MHGYVRHASYALPHAARNVRLCNRRTAAAIGQQCAVTAVYFWHLCCKVDDMLYAGGDDYTVVIYDVRKSKQVATLEGHAG